MYAYIGVPPTDAFEFFKHIDSDSAPDLSHTSFTVLALGDYNYPHFCRTGKQLDTRYPFTLAHKQTTFHESIYCYHSV